MGVACDAMSEDKTTGTGLSLVSCDYQCRFLAAGRPLVQSTFAGQALPCRMQAACWATSVFATVGCHSCKGHQALVSRGCSQLASTVLMLPLVVMPAACRARQSQTNSSSTHIAWGHPSLDQCPLQTCQHSEPVLSAAAAAPW